jgi:hypothetical protein
MTSENEPHEERQAEEPRRESDDTWALPLDDPDATWPLVERMWH